MKRSYLLINFLLVLTVSFSNQAAYRIANSHDIKQILGLYNSFSEDDKNKLLVFPANTQKEIIRKNIQQKRFFVANKDESQGIVSFLKIALLSFIICSFSND